MPAAAHTPNRTANVHFPEPPLPRRLLHETPRADDQLSASWRDRLHEYLGGTVNGLGGIPQGVGGTADHVHLHIGLRATHCLSDFMRELKKSAPVWVHEVICDPSFAWQEGYGAFTVSPTALDGVRKYIAEQEDHHRTRSFQEEFIAFLNKAGVEYNPKFLD